jgi:hypothetical protein
MGYTIAGKIYIIHTLKITVTLLALSDPGADKYFNNLI